MPILRNSLVSGFAVAALFALFARSLGFDWAPTLSFVALYALIALARIRHPKTSQDPGRGSEALRDINEPQGRILSHITVYKFRHEKSRSRIRA